ncbi:hypothetical protein H1S01_18880 [Heliobacterium chlorum]|uniref:Uncharacterized protein n=1 Tax=Heliobacterium chlorum TaxID=2698 RepID=A0ABR7T6Y1_HELCL|nr:hypothetical protein [Heliobacterium chlorum]
MVSGRTYPQVWMGGLRCWLLGQTTLHDYRTKSPIVFLGRLASLWYGRSSLMAYRKLPWLMVLVTWPDFAKSDWT